ncbi:spry domain containing socs box protein [Anaeramoeba flamelloides]|uniref:Spry domain containing socs box protein n=1 Tax=Anaeramoeba flamelloides TaxID=1746091 RepID=A0ABQ8X546_9EUKA|nr:spry domain containing socs box protein [Anaeramoeba flamelloides]
MNYPTSILFKPRKIYQSPITLYGLEYLFQVEQKDEQTTTIQLTSLSVPTNYSCDLPNTLGKNESVLISEKPNYFFSKAKKKELETFVFKFLQQSNVMKKKTDLTQSQYLELLIKGLKGTKNEKPIVDHNCQKVKKTKEEKTNAPVMTYERIEKENKELTKQILTLEKKLDFLHSNFKQNKYNDPQYSLRRFKKIYWSGCWDEESLSEHFKLTKKGKTIQKKSAESVKEKCSAYSSMVAKGAYVYQVSLQLNKLSKKDGPNFGIVPVNLKKKAYLYAGGWVIDTDGNTCMLNSKFLRDGYCEKIVQGDVLSIILDLVDGRIGFKVNDNFLGWRFKGLDTNQSYLFGVDVWDKGTTITIL